MDRANHPWLQFGISALLLVTLVVAFFCALYLFTRPAPFRPVPPNPELADAWDPGTKVPFAIAGFIDINGDGKSDLEALKKSIENNGGQVIAFQDVDGTINGKLAPNTRYLVVNDSGDDKLKKNPLVAIANRTSIPLIDAQKLVDRMSGD